MPRLRDESGGIFLMFALLTPFLLLLTALVLEIGNWYVHRRHLQLQTDAAALAAGQQFGECMTASGSALADMESTASQYGGFASGAYNVQLGGSSFAGSVTPAYESSSYPGGAPPQADDTANGVDPCTSGMFDVKATETDIPHLFAISPLATVHAHARVELRQLTQETGLLPLAVPDVRFSYAFATFVDESTGSPIAGCASGCTEQLQKSGIDAEGRQLWTAAAPIDVPLTPANVGVRLRLVAGTDPSASCDSLYTECYTDPAANNQGLLYIRTWPTTAGGATLDNAWLLAGTCSPDAYFATSDCSAGIQAEVDLGAAHPLTGGSAQVWATVDGGNTKYQLSPGSGTSGLITWTLPGGAGGLPISGSGPHTVRLSWQWTQTSGCTKKCTTANGTFGIVQRAYVGSTDSTGPLQEAEVFEQGISSSGANSFQRGSTHTLGVTIATTGTLAVQSLATDPVIKLRVTGSQNQSIDCDPDIPNLKQEIVSGCGPAYQINATFTCPSYNDLWSTPQPWECVKTQTGGAVGQAEQGFQQRILGGSNACTSPNNWPDFLKNPDDPRVVPLILTPFGTFSGSGNDVVPVIDFATFYVTGWNGDPCTGDTQVPKGYVAGHFIKYIRRSPRGVGTAKCYLTDPTQLTPCAAVLTR